MHWINKKLLFPHIHAVVGPHGAIPSQRFVCVCLTRYRYFLDSGYTWRHFLTRPADVVQVHQVMKFMETLHSMARTVCVASLLILQIFLIFLKRTLGFRIKISNPRNSIFSFETGPVKVSTLAFGY